MNALDFRVDRLGILRSLFLAGITVFGITLLVGCGRPKEEEPKSAAEPGTESNNGPSAIAQPPENSASPSPVAATSTPTPEPPKVLYVVTAFEAVSDVGTHEFPVGAEVNVLEVDGDDYVVEYNGVAVRNGRQFFSEVEVTESVTPAAEASPSPAAETAAEGDPTPEATPTPSPTPDMVPLAAPDATPDPALAQEEEKSAELLGEIRSLNDEIRQAEDEEIQSGSSPDEAAESPKVKKLKNRRDSLSEDLTDFAKP